MLYSRLQFRNPIPENRKLLHALRGWRRMFHDGYLPAFPVARRLRDADSKRSPALSIRMQQIPHTLLTEVAAPHLLFLYSGFHRERFVVQRRAIEVPVQ